MLTSSKRRLWDEGKIERASQRGFNKVLRELRRISPPSRWGVKVRGRGRGPCQPPERRRVYESSGRVSTSALPGASRANLPSACGSMQQLR